MRKIYDKMIPTPVRYGVWMLWPIVLGGWLCHGAYQNLGNEPNSLAWTMLIAGAALIIGRVVEATVFGLRHYLSTGPRARAAQERQAQTSATPAADPAVGEQPSP